MARTDTLDHYLTDVASAIKTKLGSQTPILASAFDTAIASIPSGGGTTLEYETGTYTPETSVSRPTISFTNTHTRVPSIVVFADTSDPTILTSSSQLEFISVMFTDTIGTSAVYDGVNYCTGGVFYRYKSSSNFVQSFSGFKTNAEAGTSTDINYWIKNTEFYPSTYSQSRYWRANRTYKWYALWL